mmetsp:Transcript_43787/g.111902  ORF Transcript_43787/g.111902 Transcript_43787/m.111902 type:complete len:207 (-) Transcript_43787:69-689(-)
MRFKIPCGPSKISLKKLMMATHTMGDTSTPNWGGTTLRVATSSHSVGKNTAAQGSLEPSICGYQVVTIRTTISSVPTANKGPRIADMVAAFSGVRSATVAIRLGVAAPLATSQVEARLRLSLSAPPAAGPAEQADRAPSVRGLWSGRECRMRSGCGADPPRRPDCQAVDGRVGSRATAAQGAILLATVILQVRKGVKAARLACRYD